MQRTPSAHGDTRTGHRAIASAPEVRVCYGDGVVGTLAVLGPARVTRPDGGALEPSAGAPFALRLAGTGLDAADTASVAVRGGGRGSGSGRGRCSCFYA